MTGHRVFPREAASREDLISIRAMTGRAYDLAASKYHELFRNEIEEKPYDRNLLDVFAGKFEPGSLICDAGCGPSAQSGRYLAGKGMKVIGIDVSGRCVEMARKANPGLEFKCEDIAGTSFGDGALDGVIAFYSIIHTPKKFLGEIFREFWRVLKPGGRLLVAVKAGFGEGLLEELLGIKTEIYFSLFKERELAELFSGAGFVMEFLERRHPYDFEIKNDRIYAIGRAT